jgi:hypothetical protein
MTHIYHEGSGFAEVNAGVSAYEGEREEDTMGWDMLKILMAETVAARNGLRARMWALRTWDLWMQRLLMRTLSRLRVWMLRTYDLTNSRTGVCGGVDSWSIEENHFDLATSISTGQTINYHIQIPTVKNLAWVDINLQSACPSITSNLRRCFSRGL